ncbi:hypothetical protein EUBVEN_00113 [Eubacterium ventriosum ATCC 27560]|uniref:Uncharacterized protein n=1 Tax=Eubacterium ventriosum ATCC 27560 TaxID=411463 RepID=A5Z367_9FIRM|nr:hypothetical protein EUBVEN_00113 [Eubacterium ventriosum ATCC 27560]
MHSIAIFCLKSSQTAWFRKNCSNSFFQRRIHNFFHRIFSTSQFCCYIFGAFFPHCCIFLCKGCIFFCRRCIFFCRRYIFFCRRCIFFCRRCIFFCISCLFRNRSCFLNCIICQCR